MHNPRNSRSFALVMLVLVLQALGWCGTLQEALKSREKEPIADVVRHFEAALADHDNPLEKATILSLMAEFLVRKRKFTQAIKIYEKILETGPVSAKAGAYFFMAQAYLMENDTAKAKKICAVIQNDFPESSLIPFAISTRETFPSSTLGKLGQFFMETSDSSVSKSPENRSERRILKVNEVSPGLSEKTFRVRTRVTKGSPGRKKLSELTVTAWNSGLDGRLSAKGMNLRLERGGDFGTSAAFGIRALWKFTSRDELILDYRLFDHNGFLTTGVTFDTLAYTPGASIDVENRVFDVGMSRLWKMSKRGSWRLLYGTRVHNTFVRLSQAVRGGGRQAGELTTDMVVPYLGVKGVGRLSPNLALVGSWKFFPWHRSGGGMSLSDFDVGFLLGRNHSKRPSDIEWHATLGYRLSATKGSDESDSAEIRFSGPTFGVSSVF